MLFEHLAIALSLGRACINVVRSEIDATKNNYARIFRRDIYYEKNVFLSGYRLSSGDLQIPATSTAEFSIKYF